METKVKYPVLLCLASVALLSSAWLGLGGFPLLVAFVPLLLLNEKYRTGRRSGWKMYGWASLTFSLWFLATTWWVWYAAWFGPLAITIACILLFGTVFIVFHHVSRRAPRTLAYTILVTGWIAFEQLYMYGEISFPWLTLGNGFANNVRTIQWYDTTGVFGGTLWIWLCNIAVFETLRTKRSKGWIMAAVLVLIPLTISLIKYYTYEEPSDKVIVHAVQPNIDPWEEKFILSQDVQTERLLKLSSDAPANADFILMPETALHENIWENSLEQDPLVNQFRQLATVRYPHTQFIIGASTFRRYDAGESVPSTARTREYIDYWYDVYNTALGISANSSVEVYHKSVLVVGAEKMPYMNILRHLEFLIVDLGGTTGQLGVDTVRTVMTNPRGICSGTAICYESIYGQYFSEFIRNGAQVMFVITNDGWWKDTPGYRQHFSYSRLRAIETRRSIGRSANTGISGFINQRGDVLTKLGWDIEGSTTSELALNDKLTFYNKYGDYIARISVLVYVLSLLYFVAYRFRKKSRLVD